VRATEAAALLTIAASFDNRKPDADTAKAWAMALDGLRFEDCRQVVVEHYRSSREWLMPSDVISGVKRVRNQRVKDFGVLPDPPSHIDPDSPEHLRWVRDTTKAIADGTYVPEPTERTSLPPGEQERQILALGKAGQTVDAATAARSVREAHEQARRELQEAAAEEKRAEDARRAERHRKREEARAALASARANARPETTEESPR
jgi:hypothetical protein